jgi:predicted amidohydrolase
MQKAAAKGAHLLHTPEACLSGYAGSDYKSFAGYDWDQLHWHTTCLRNLAAELDQWLVLGSAHFLSNCCKPTNCLYLIGPKGQIVDRYDKCMCTDGDQQHYSAGNRLVVKKINGLKVGLAICYDICYPQIYAAYREKGAELMLHSFYNARGHGPNCLDVLNRHQVTTRCADNTLWAVANNSSHPYSNWASFVARPDATIAKKLPQNRPGMLVHDFPDGLSEGGWLHNFMPMKLASNEKLWRGKPSAHPRQKNGRSEPCAFRS